jgi:hypothetical protein
MNVPFTTEQFLEVFRQYNQAIWPLQIVAYLIAAASLGAVLWPRSGGRAIASLMLAGFWMWTGVAYHITYFSRINSAAVLFGACFILQGGLFIWSGIIRSQLELRFRPGLAGCTGALLIIYAMVLYPLLGHTLGHRFPGAPTFGVTPCPTVIFTFGLFLWSEGKLPRYLMIIPSAWALLGFTAALQFGMYEDLGLLVAALIADLLILVPKLHGRRPQPASA